MLENLKLDTEVYTGLIGHCFTYSHVKKKVFKVLYTILFKKKNKPKKHISHITSGRIFTHLTLQFIEICRLLFMLSSLKVPMWHFKSGRTHL